MGLKRLLWVLIETKPNDSTKEVATDEGPLTQIQKKSISM